MSDVVYGGAYFPTTDQARAVMSHLRRCIRGSHEWRMVGHGNRNLPPRRMMYFECPWCRAWVEVGVPL